MLTSPPGDLPLPARVADIRPKIELRTHLSCKFDDDAGLIEYYYPSDE